MNRATVVWICALMLACEPGGSVAWTPDDQSLYPALLEALDETVEWDTLRIHPRTIRVAPDGMGFPGDSETDYAAADSDELARAVEEYPTAVLCTRGEYGGCRFDEGRFMAVSEVVLNSDATATAWANVVEGLGSPNVTISYYRLEFLRSLEGWRAVRTELVGYEH